MKTNSLALAFFLLLIPAALQAADMTSAALIDQLLGDPKAPDAAAKRASLQLEIGLQDKLIKEAQKEGVMQTPAYAMRMELARRNLIVELYWRAFLEKHPVDDKMVKAAYDQLKIANDSKQYRLHWIATQDEAAAKQALAALARKEAFEGVAAKYSIDRASNAQGGDLGWRLRSSLYAPVAEALLKMKQGETSSAPIPIVNGFVILRLDEIGGFPDFEALKPQIGNAIFQQAREEEVKRLQAAK